MEEDNNAFKDICVHFDNYDFDKDTVFQHGWNKIKERISDCAEVEKQLFSAKLFYYSKHFQPLTLETYVSWKRSQNPSTAEREGSNTDSSIVDPGQAAMACLSQDMCTSIEPSASQIPTSANNCVDVDETQPQYPTSFVDVMRLVQEGAEIPGLLRLNVQATNLSVSESEMKRPKKPWEK